MMGSESVEVTINACHCFWLIDGAVAPVEGVVSSSSNGIDKSNGSRTATH
jgi:hypothetical protein